MKLHSAVKVTFVAICALFANSKPCRADFISNGNLQTGTGALGYIPTNNYMLGYQFTVGTTPLAVTRLGMFDSILGSSQIGLGLFESHQVGLWNSSGTLLASVTVSQGNATPLTGAFRYVQLGSSVLLSAGQTYTIAAHFATSYSSNTFADMSDVLFSAAIPGAFSPLMSFTSSVWGSSGFALPTTNLGNSYATVAANAEFVSVPVPNGVFLAGIGVVCLAFIRFKRVKNSTSIQHQSPTSPSPAA